MTRPSNAELREAIWQAIKGWDLERSHGEGYAGATGTDVQTILDAVEPVFQAREQQLLTEARLSERAWAYKNMRDHGTDPQWVEIAKLRMERLQNKTNDGGS